MRVLSLDTIFTVQRNVSLNIKAKRGYLSAETAARLFCEYQAKSLFIITVPNLALLQPITGNILKQENQNFKYALDAADSLEKVKGI